MADHVNPIISKIQLPDGGIYEIHDSAAIHSIGDLGLEEAMKFRGVVEKIVDLPESGNTPGDIYHVIENDQEYVWVKIEGQGSHWEEFGSKFVVDHTHDVTGTVSVAGANQESAVTGTGTGSVSVPSVSKEAKYIKGATASVVNSVEATKDVNAITGFGAHETKSAIAGLNTTTINTASASDVNIPNVTANEEVSASKITGNTDVVASKVTAEGVTASKITGNADVVASKVEATAGTAAAWSASVADGVLAISWVANVPTAVSASDVTASKVTAEEVAASKVTAQDVTASKVTAESVAASKVTLGTAIAASKVSTSEVIVATGASDTISAITGLGTPTTSTVVSGISVGNADVVGNIVAGTAADGVSVGDVVTIGSETKDVNVNVTGTAAAQVWGQTSGSFSGTTGAAK